MGAGDTRAMNRLVRSLERDHGCVVTRTRNSHWRVTRPGRRGIVILGHSPSDERSFRNSRADLKRELGVIL